MWRTAQLSEVCKIISGNSIPEKKKEELFTNVEGVPYVATKDLGFDGTINYKNGISIPEKHLKNFKISQQNSTLICAEGGSAGRKIAFSAIKCCFVNKLFSITPNDLLNEKYVYYYTLGNEFQSQFRDSLHGLIGGVSLSKIKQFLISFPPLAEQQRIVAKLDSAFAEIDLLSYKNREKLRNCESLLEAGVQAVIDESLKEAELVELESLCDPGRGITYGVIKLGDEVDDGVPCLRTSNVKRRKITTHGMKRISRNLSDEYDRTILKGGEVLVNVRGTLGGVAVVPSDMIGWNISREVALVPVSSSKVEPEYLSLFISSQSSQKWLNRNTRGAAYQGINLSDLRKLPVYVPTKDEQLRIVHRLGTLVSEFESLQKILDRTITELEKLKSAILTQELQPSEAA